MTLSSRILLIALVAPLLWASCSEYKVNPRNEVLNGTAETQGDDDDATSTTTTDSGWQWDPNGDDDDDTVPGDDDDDTTSDTDTTPGGTGSTTWDTGNWDLCDWALHVAGFLDAYNTPGDGKVIYCHQSGGPNYVMQDTSVSSCLTHIAHAGDVFPTSICDS